METSWKWTATGVFLFILGLSVDSHAQKDPETFTAKQVAFAELGGSAGRYAVSYGRIFHQQDQLKLSGSLGFSMWHHNTSNWFYNTSRSVYWLPAIPVEISALFGQTNHHLEIGAGFNANLTPTPKRDPVTAELTDDIVWDSVVVLRIGYRYQKPEGGLFFRVGYTPFFSPPSRPNEGANFQPISAGISVGKSF